MLGAMKKMSVVYLGPRSKESHYWKLKYRDTLFINKVPASKI